MPGRTDSQQEVLDAQRRLWPDELAFDAGVYAARLDIVQGEMRDRGLAMVVLFDPEAMFWLTGYQTIGYFTFQATCVPTQGQPEIVTRVVNRDMARALPTIAEAHPVFDTEDHVEVLERYLDQAAPEGAHVLAVPVLAGLAATWVLRGDELAGWRHVVGAALSGLALLASLAVLPSLAHVLSTDPSAARTLGALLAVFAAVAVGPSLERVAPRKLATIVGVAGLGLGLVAGLLQAAGA